MPEPEPELEPEPAPPPSVTLPATQGTSTAERFTHKEKLVSVTPTRDRTVNRKLRGIHLFGLYWRGGQILELGGPLAVLLAFLIVGFLAWAVMQCITEMLCIWPIPGSFSVYVSEFVDPELGIAVGVAYWYTYSISYAALITTTSAYLHFWVAGEGQNGFYGGVVYFLIPVSMIAMNAVGVQPTASNIEKDMSLHIAAFAYTGVEIVAASALEVKWPHKDKKDDRVATDFSQRSEQSLLVGKTVKFSSVYISFLATIAYTVAGTLASSNMHRSDCSLPRLSWLTSSECPEHLRESKGFTKSVFVAIAKESGIPHLANAFNVFLIFTAITCACTNLFVSSRSLFGVTTRLDGGPGQPGLLRLLAFFGRTNRNKVPLRAMIFSAAAFWWVPFLELKGGNGVGMFIEILTTMGSVSIIIVWGSQCWAFIRYYRCIYRHREALDMEQVAQVRRWNQDANDDYPYRSHGQPFLAFVALIGCLLIILVSTGASLWNGFHFKPFLSGYLVIFTFLGSWVILKIVRGAKWSLVDLDNAEKVINKIRNLHDIRVGAT
ncbi:hypothetical protein ACO1O0_006692 [Amphichorda felina]